MDTEDKTAWARAWFSGQAYCPKCKEDAAMQTLRTDSAGATLIDTWACSCGHRWKIELRETAALADATDADTEWMEHRPFVDEVLEHHTPAGARRHGRSESSPSRRALAGEHA